APRSPGLAGAAAGLAASGAAVVLYASHCPDDSPLFVAVWYSSAIAIVAAAGFLAGARLLRWS
ncbi:MAG: NrsF family protein, partial [Alphaproteobacteria bacterium]|nr:NrsF family protein [Alphaproteobacteria bacterium]